MYQISKQPNCNSCSSSSSTSSGRISSSNSSSIGSPIRTTQNDWVSLIGLVGASPLNLLSKSPLPEHHHQQLEPLSPAVSVGSTMMSFSLTSPPLNGAKDGSNDSDYHPAIHQQMETIEKIIPMNGSGKSESTNDLGRPLFSPSMFSPSKTLSKTGHITKDKAINYDSNNNQDSATDSDSPNGTELLMNPAKSQFSAIFSIASKPPLRPLSSTSSVNDKDDLTTSKSKNGKETIDTNNRGKQPFSIFIKKTDNGKMSITDDNDRISDDNRKSDIAPSSTVVPKTEKGLQPTVRGVICNTSATTANAASSSLSSAAAAKDSAPFLHQKYFNSPAGPNVSVSNAIVTADSFSKGILSTSSTSKRKMTVVKDDMDPSMLSPADDQSNKSACTDSCDRSTGSTVSGNAGGSSNVQCKCRKSRCLKLYCDCFAILQFCGTSCNCVNCHNTVEHEVTRQKSINQIKERKTLAFQSKISDTKGHAFGCHCRQSHCLKKYCECFTGGAFCADNCRCSNCYNKQGSEELALVKDRVSQRAPSEDSKKRKTVTESTISPQMVSSKYSTPNAPRSADEVGTTGEGKGTGMGASASADEGKGTKSSSTRRKMGTRSSTGGTGSVTRGKIKEKNSAGNAVKTNDYEDEYDDDECDGGTQGQIRSWQNGTPRGQGNNATRNSVKKGMVSKPCLTQSFDSKSTSAKKKNVKFALHKDVLPIYPFFGNHNASTPKVIALRCLEYLESSEIYQMSIVNKMWCEASTDNALWE